MKEIELKELREIELHILDFVSNFCEDVGLTYFLCGGTLLGAVRHKGFIPWDDDIDIMMPRPDYERFLTEFPEHEYLKVMCHRRDKHYPFAFATVGDSRTWKYEKNLRKKYTKELCVNVDVFPIDGLPDCPKEIKRFYSAISLKGKILQSATYKLGKGKTLLSTMMKNISILLFRATEIVGINSSQKILLKWNLLASTFDFNSAHIVGITAISHYGIKEANNKAIYSDKIKVEFEGKLYNAPVGYDTYLSQLYGKYYMDIPSKDKQFSHHISKCYWK